ncbi:hypothetical protein LSCM1_08247 [Leishmania martiniquensis]|uniref:SRP9 domain-containing protein n=1 Tax=Leishmania martiniquensis TaxID=1580590 RepID=A0A836GTK3_9TRYP|nr:hypothetical protein LSCM1_08247 [Leishmania martiniquensis]
MRLELKGFAQAVRSMHQQPGGVKRTRLMLRLRPHHSRKVFVLKATDGRVTVTTRVEHYGQLRLVENLVNEFVTECAKATVSSPATHTAAAGAGDPQAISAASASPVSAAAGHKNGNLGAASAAAPMSGTGQSGTGSSATHGQQTQVSPASQANDHNDSGSGVVASRRQSRGQKGKHR